MRLLHIALGTLVMTGWHHSPEHSDRHQDREDRRIERDYRDSDRGDRQSERDLWRSEHDTDVLGCDARDTCPDDGDDEDDGE
jgi:hypothetical protein